jgi:hypothetical protein
MLDACLPAGRLDTGYWIRPVYDGLFYFFASNIQYPASSIQHPVSSIQYPASSIFFLLFLQKTNHND